MPRFVSEYGMVVDSERPWLGGYFPDGDPGCHVPQLWEWALAHFKIHSVVDIGCGAGSALDWFQEHGCEVLGVDGLPPEDPRIVEHDYTTGPYVPPRSFDLAWSCEFVEHVEERFAPNFIATFQSARYLMMTHGLVGQGGHHHVNCQQPEYWVDLLARRGFVLLEEETYQSHNLTPHHYWRNSGLIFERHG